jgi:uncharacterized protein (DUF2267 family)
MVDEKILTLKEWKEITNQLKNSYKSFTKLQEDCAKIIPCDFAIVYQKGMAVIYPESLEDAEEFHRIRDAVIYKRIGSTIKRVDTEKLVSEIVNVLKDKISVEKLLEDVINDIDPEDLEEIYERAVVKKGKIREEEGCYKLLIGGKRGAPFELMLRGGE